MKRMIGIFLLLLSSFIVAGPNQDARLLLDFDITTDKIDSVGGCPEESTLVVGVRIHDAQALYSYEVYVKFDTLSLEFVSAKKDNDVVTNGGRILGVTALGSDIKDAIDRAYRAVDKISFEKAYCRRDIGHRALERE